MTGTDPLAAIRLNQEKDMQHQQEEVVSGLLASGADLVGFADVSDMTFSDNAELKSAIAIGIAYDPCVVAQLDSEATPEMLTAHLTASGLLTDWQAKNLLMGRARGFHLGDYTLQGQLGRGGMGSVFLARHRLIDRQVAIKIFSSKLGEEEAMLRRFDRELPALALEVGVVVPGIAVEAPAVELDDAGRQPLQEGAVVGDE